jgi:hypothetical protein
MRAAGGTTLGAAVSWTIAVAILGVVRTDNAAVSGVN